jgi:hypothetical protein
MPKEAWEAYIAMRKQMGKKYIATEYAQKLLIAKLEKWKKEGHDITEIIHQSIENSWQGLFPVKQLQGINDRRHSPRMYQPEDLPVADREVAKAALRTALSVSKTRH